MFPLRCYYCFLLPATALLHRNYRKDRWWVRRNGKRVNTRQRPKRRNGKSSEFDTFRCVGLFLPRKTVGPCRHRDDDDDDDDDDTPETRDTAWGGSVAVWRAFSYV